MKSMPVKRPEGQIMSAQSWTFSIFMALGLSLGMAGTAVAQSTLNPLPAPTLEPTIKVYPSPEVVTPDPGGAVARQCVCTMQYEPVCARNPDGTQTTYSNSCQAACANATPIWLGPC